MLLLGNFHRHLHCIVEQYRPTNGGQLVSFDFTDYGPGAIGLDFTKEVKKRTFLIAT